MDINDAHDIADRIREGEPVDIDDARKAASVAYWEAGSPEDEGIADHIQEHVRRREVIGQIKEEAAAHADTASAGGTDWEAAYSSAIAERVGYAYDPDAVQHRYGDTCGGRIVRINSRRYCMECEAEVTAPRSMCCGAPLTGDAGEPVSCGECGYPTAGISS